MAAPFGSQNIASTGSAYASEASYTNFFKVAYSDDVRLKSMRLDHPMLNVFEREVLNGAPLVLHLVKKVEEGFGPDYDITDAGTTTVDSVLTRNRNRVAQITYGAVPTETRTVLPNFWHFAHLFDPRDKKALMRDVRPGSNFQKAVMSSMLRKLEKGVISAIDGSATVDGSATTFVNDGGLTVGVASGDPDTLTGADTTGDNIFLTTDKLLDARQKIEVGDGCSPGDRLVCIMSPRQMHLFMQNDSSVVNFDFNRDKPLAKGIVSDWLGMDIIVSNAIEELDPGATGAPTADPFSIVTSDPGQGSTGEYVYVCTRDSVLMGYDPVDTRFDIIPERGHSLQVAHYTNFGAVRLDGSKICRIQCATGIA